MVATHEVGWNVGMPTTVLLLSVPGTPFRLIEGTRGEESGHQESRQDVARGAGEVHADVPR